MSAINAALAAAVTTAAVALPAAASTGTSNGGASATPQPQSQTTSDQRAQTADYRRVKATWYGPGLWGHRLACGGRLTHSTIGVAHRSLPCGTDVALRYRGRTIVVPVVDRGPYSRGVSYDLTQATARELGVTETTRLAAAPLKR